jgi:hypothetical protein
MAFVRLNQLASMQSKATENVERYVEELMQYMATYPNAALVYHRSAMILNTHSDGGGHGRGARVAGVHFCGDPYDPHGEPSRINGALLIVCVLLKVVTAHVVETEYAALYYNGREAEQLRLTLEDLGHPQPPTPMVCDNTCATGIANKVVKQKRSKAIDTRFHWIRDRVSQDHFFVHWRPGQFNLADYFTKLHPTKHCREMRKYYVTDGPLLEGRSTKHSLYKNRQQ